MKIKKIIYDEIFNQDTIRFYSKNRNSGKLYFKIDEGTLINYSSYSRINNVIKYLTIENNFILNRIISKYELPKNISNKYLVRSFEEYKREKK